jgi:pantetheine-phosphate adenylyltransferase
MVGLYAGSFNPFHKGHYNILQKAEAIFERVIIARGQNENKPEPTWPFPELIKDREIVRYHGLLTEFIDSLDYEVTLIRGLRNASDLEHELTFYRYNQQFKPDIKVVSLFCDVEFLHYSSSTIKTLPQHKQKEFLL